MLTYKSTFLSSLTGSGEGFSKQSLWFYFYYSNSEIYPDLKAMYKNCSKIRVERDLDTLYIPTIYVDDFFFFKKTSELAPLLFIIFLLGNSYLSYFNHEYRTLASADLFWKTLNCGETATSYCYSTIDKVDLIKFQCNLPIDRISASIFIPDDQDRRILRPWSRSVAREYGNIPDYSFWLIRWIFGGICNNKKRKK